jgi:hypothetical protein
MKLLKPALHQAKKIQQNKFYLNALILLIIIFWQLNGLGKVNYRLLVSPDQQIQMLTSAKMHYFDYSSYEAAWNHHSPFIHSVYKVIYYTHDFNLATYGEYLLYTCFLIFLSISLFTILKILTNNISMSFIASLTFVFDISSSTIGGKVIFDNRTLGIFFQAIILLNCLNYLKSNKNIYLYLISIFSILQIYNLESYGITILGIYLYLIYIEKNYIKFFTHSTIASMLTIFYLLIINTLNGELDEFFDLNILFHFDSIGLTNKFESINTSTLLKNLFVGGNTNVSLFVSLFIVLFVFISFLVKYKAKSIKENENIIYVLLFGEFVHLFLTGPRFTSYAQILLLPIYILFFINVLGLLEKMKISKIFGYFVFFLIFFIMQFGDVVNNRTSLIDGTFKETLESYNKPAEDPNLILTWVNIDKYENVFFENNSLPSTRLWWWHQMKFIDEFYDKDYKMFDDELLEAVFTEDVNSEKPNLAIIDTSIVNPPHYFLEYIKKNFKILKIDGDLEIYELNN